MARIGIFDSGIGGLTLASEVGKRLNGHQIIYFGDTAHFPYGDKSSTAIQSYSIKICNLLLEKECDVILIACNSASASAFELVREYVGSRAKVFNVIDSVVEYVVTRYSNSAVGLIGTKRTVSSNVYLKKVDASNSGVKLHSLASPLLAPMIEEGFFRKQLSYSIISEYLSDASLVGIKALILGCTHYPLIKKQVEDYYLGKVSVIDTPEIVVSQISNYLIKESLLPSENEVQHFFYVSDYTESFKEATKIFFGKEVPLEEYRLWE